MRKLLKKAQKGFTLIELMIVVAIIGILAAVAIPMFLDSIKKAKKSEAPVQIKKLQTRAKEERAASGNWPLVMGMGISQALTPMGACYGATPEHKCVVNPADWNVPGWQAMDFSMDEPFFFQYSVTTAVGAGNFNATARGDLDGDTTTIDYTVSGVPTATGGMTFAVVEPLPNTD